MAQLTGWLSGLALLQFAPRLAEPGERLALAALTAGLIGLAWRWKAGRAAVTLALAGVLGLLWADQRACWRLDEGLTHGRVGEIVELEAEVAALPQALQGFGGTAGWRLLLDLDPVPGLPGRVSVSWFPGPGREQAPRAGERWRVQLRLKPVHALQNPGLPDTEFWLLERGVRAQGTLKGGARLREAAWWNLEAWRERARRAIERRVDDPRARSVLMGLSIGDQGALPASDWALLRDTGVVHLFSISGLHITGFAWLAGAAVGLLWRRSAGLCGRWPAVAATRWLGLLAAFAYALLAGWGVPAQRTVGLLAVLALLHSSARIWPWPMALLLAAAVIGAADPWAMVSAGFWLSFAAVALLMHAAPSLPPDLRGWRRLRLQLLQGLQVQMLASIGLAPLTLLFFGQVSLVGLGTNVLAVPLVSLVLAPLSLLGLLLPWAWDLAAWINAGLFAVLIAAARLPGAVWWAAQAPWVWQVLGLSGLLLVLPRWPRPWRALGALLLLPLGLWRPAAPQLGGFELTAFDVGQGSAIAVRTRQHSLLFDAGPRWGGGSDAGARILVPALRAQGLRRLDALVISHADADHSGGAWSVAQALAPDQVWGSSLPPRHPLQARLQACAVGRGWDWDGVRFEWLHPLPGASGRSNARACVLRVQAANGRAVLLSADIEAAQEAELQARGAPLRADLLLVPHHGSKTSSTPDFVAAVGPRLALAQNGAGNRHGHPAASVQQTYAALGIPLLSSPACGALRWSSRAPPGGAGCRRAERRRYWLAPPPRLPELDEEDIAPIP